MTTTQKMLSGLLVSQLVLAVVTWGTSRAVPEPTAAVPVVAWAVDDIRKISIVGERPEAGGDAPTIALERRGDAWLIPAVGDYPADSEKVNELLERLTALKIGAPIATNDANHEALGVGTRNYGRKVTLATKNETRRLVLGNGPRSSVHVRVDDDREVYAARGMTVWNVRSDLRSFVDTQYVKVDPAKLSTVNISNASGTLTFANRGGEWELAEVPPGAELDPAKIKPFLNAVARWHFSEPVGRDVKSDYRLGDEVSVVLVSTGDDDKTDIIRYQIGAKAGERMYYAKADNREFVVKVAAAAVEQLRTKTVADFVKDPTASE